MSRDTHSFAHAIQMPPEGYIWHDSGALMSRDRTITAKYDHAYVARYEKYPEQALSRIRADLAERFHLGWNSVCDVGCGTGAFLAEMDRRNWTAKIAGHDVSDYPLPQFIERVPEWSYREWDVLTFFDSLEHFQHLGDLNLVRAKTIIISVPWYHPELGNDWFNTWKHKRPGEHLWHFTPGSLSEIFGKFDYRTVFIGSPEDAVRGSAPWGSNILTMVFQR
jgi:hypothetical protein